MQHPVDMATQQNQRLIVISNRLPISVEKNEDGGWNFKLSSGGLVAALSGLKMSFVWIGWPGTWIPEEEQEEFKKQLYEQQKCIPVFLDDKLADEHYNGFSNGILWPLFHYIQKDTHFDFKLWKSYCTANKEFANVVEEVYQEGDLVWVHDYHLMMFPRYFREKVPSAQISFFLHIPFPSSEIYKVLPVRAELLVALLHCSMLGFHTYDYSRHFLQACSYILGVETGPRDVVYKGNSIPVGIFPVGIDVDKWLSYLPAQDVIERVKELELNFKGCTVFIGVDRLDYIKGVPHKLRAFEMFLKQHPEVQNRVVLIQIAVPSRQDVVEYQKLKKEVEEIVGSVNGRYGGLHHNPIHYLFKSVNPTELAALYSISDACVVTSIRDGMNLVCQEYIVCQQKRHGVVILSEFAGAAQSLSSTIRVNPWDTQEVADAFWTVLNMSAEERRERHESNYRFIAKHTASNWGESFVNEMKNTARIQHSLEAVPHLDIDKTVESFIKTKQRFVLLDYDIVDFMPSKKEANPVFMKHLNHLASDEHNTVFILSGRDRAVLDEWFGKESRVGLLAEHGYFVKYPGTDWKHVAPELNLDWMKTIKPVIEYFTKRTPGSYVEQTEVYITWQYRNCPRSFGQLQAQELQNYISQIADFPIEMVRKHLALEFRPRLPSMATIAKQIIEQYETEFDFFMYVGDVTADLSENMKDLVSLNDTKDNGMLVSVGHKQIEAQSYLKHSGEVISLVEQLSLAKSAPQGA
jgi:trehalose 6-phosphate synthase/phosphatase